MLLLAKKIGNKRSKTREEDESKGMRVVIELKTNVISDASEKKAMSFDW